VLGLPGGVIGDQHDTAIGSPWTSAT
jgi:hypothetical protein